LPRDKSESHEKIITAAYDEFLKYGFKDASMRRIAAACDMSAAGLYRHYPSKEEMFAALVEPAFSGLKKAYLETMDLEMQQMDDVSEESLWEESHETVMLIRYIYDNLNSFKLIVCKSQGTRYENYIHELADIEEKLTYKYLNVLKKKGIRVKKIAPKEMHLLVTSNLSAIFTTVEHDMSIKEAVSYAKHLDMFYTAGWKKLLGIE